MTNELYHHGILGQKWGVRRYQNADGTLTGAGKKRYYKATAKQAKKDAKEYARAKMFYGEGAGTRRKLINNSVKERSKAPAYKEAFDKYLSEQDMAKHASKAKIERKRKDASNSVRKTSRGLFNIATGHPERAGAALVATAGAAAILHKTKVDKMIVNSAKSKINDIRNSVDEARGRSWVNSRTNSIKFEVRDD